jgi:hypothetical protein
MIFKDCRKRFQCKSSHILRASRIWRRENYIDERRICKIRGDEIETARDGAKLRVENSLSDPYE